jgi:uncharacterized alpha-E superfamily protein
MNAEPMLSRAADAVYWTSRYIERAENIARIIDINHQLTIDPAGNATEQWEPIVSISGDRSRFYERYTEPSRANVIHFFTFDGENPNSILSCLRAARENARTVREIISSEMWEQINRSYLMVMDAQRREATTDSPWYFFQDIRLAGRLFEGVTAATLSHGEAYHFIGLGRMLERADKITRLLDLKYFVLLPSLGDIGTAFDDSQWMVILRSANAFEMYRKRYGRVSPTQIVEFLLLDRKFPRSLHFCALKALESLRAITGSSPGTFTNRAEQRLGILASELDYKGVDEVFETGLHQYLDGMQSRLNEIGDNIFEAFFALRPTQCSREAGVDS